MKKSIIYQLLALFIMCNNQLKAQCEVARLSIKDSLSVKALRGFITNVQQKDANLLDNLVNKKTQYVIVSETRRCMSDEIDRRTFVVGICNNNYFKNHKKIINGYFYLDNILYLVISYGNSLQTSDYDYDNPCLKKLFANHTLKEYVPNKRVKEIRNNAEAEVIVRGDRIYSFGCVIILDVKTNEQKEAYQILYQLD